MYTHSLFKTHGHIPDDEVWLKFGGDHGGGSIKFCLQVENVENPNSILNAIPVSIVKAKDTVANISTALQPYNKQIIELQGSVWQ